MGDCFQQQKSLNMPPTFAEKIPKHTPHFCNFTVDTRYRRRSSEPSYHPIFGQIFDFEIFNYFDSGHSAQHIVKLSVSNLL